jgi:hypothetical protein
VSLGCWKRPTSCRPIQGCWERRAAACSTVWVAWSLGVEQTPAPVGVTDQHQAAGAGDAGHLGQGRGRAIKVLQHPLGAAAVRGTVGERQPLGVGQADRNAQAVGHASLRRRRHGGVGVDVHDQPGRSPELGSGLEDMPAAAAHIQQALAGRQAQRRAGSVGYSRSPRRWSLSGRDGRPATQAAQQCRGGGSSRWCAAPGLSCRSRHGSADAWRPVLTTPGSGSRPLGRPRRPLCAAGQRPADLRSWVGGRVIRPAHAML